MNKLDDVRNTSAQDGDKTKVVVIFSDGVKLSAEIALVSLSSARIYKIDGKKINRNQVKKYLLTIGMGDELSYYIKQHSNITALHSNSLFSMVADVAGVNRWRETDYEVFMGELEC